eukprot:gnl/MRDRNA2_/MRDRNA2_163983_c0_seq1.p1 gnl/MRDRNA2_/MRDRNA2_163983_c0~~gnl/MRDRNA2_/MRDRNA2_163983_c0_seq1.p1  ORF type:complete len:369 (-),score=60.80 gnl/MRDRNA2_/MRDRNA2_163983_c0_seq1:22-1128(-)
MKKANSCQQTQTHYDVLEIDPWATPNEVRKAYKKLALVYHPDKRPEAERDEVAIFFKTVHAAYEVLCDPTARRRYDARIGVTATGRQERSSSVPLFREGRGNASSPYPQTAEWNSRGEWEGKENAKATAEQSKDASKSKPAAQPQHAASPKAAQGPQGHNSSRDFAQSSSSSAAASDQKAKVPAKNQADQAKRSVNGTEDAIRSEIRGLRSQLQKSRGSASSTASPAGSNVSLSSLAATRPGSSSSLVGLGSTKPGSSCSLASMNATKTHGSGSSLSSEGGSKPGNSFYSAAFVANMKTVSSSSSVCTMSQTPDGPVQTEPWTNNASKPLWTDDHLKVVQVEHHIPPSSFVVPLMGCLVIKICCLGGL